MKHISFEDRGKSTDDKARFILCINHDSEGKVLKANDDKLELNDIILEIYRFVSGVKSNSGLYSKSEMFNGTMRFVETRGCIGSNPTNHELIKILPEHLKERLEETSKAYEEALRRAYQYWNSNDDCRN